MNGQPGSCPDQRNLHPHCCRVCNTIVGSSRTVCQDIGLRECGHCGATDWGNEAFPFDYESRTLAT